jgi:hypothetical protein
MHQRLRRRLFPLTLLLPLLLLLAASSAVGCGAVGSDGAGGLADVAAGADAPAPPPDVPPVGPDVPATVDLAQPPSDVVGPPPPPFAFVPATGDGPGGDVWAEASLERAASGGGDQLVVRLQAGGFADLLGFAFDLRYHPGIVTLASVELMDVLSGTTWQGRCAARERGTGRLNVGCSRFLVGQDILSLAQYGGPLEGPASFAIVRFAVKQDGEFDLVIDPARRLARTGEGAVLDVSWRGGRVAIQRDADTAGGAR